MTETGFWTILGKDGWDILYGVPAGYHHQAYDLLHGECDTFARCLHERYGYDIEIAYAEDDDEEFLPSLVHAYCVAELDGKKLYIDVRGITDSFEKFMEDFEDWFEIGSDWSFTVRSREMPDRFMEGRENETYMAAMALIERCKGCGCYDVREIRATEARPAA